MCKVCFEDFIEATGGMSEGADPPAYNADAKPKVTTPIPLMGFYMHTSSDAMSLQRGGYITALILAFAEEEEEGRGARGGVCASWP